MDSVSVALRAVALQSWFSIGAVCSVVVVAFLGIWGLLRWSAGRRAWQAAGIWLSGCLAMMMYGLVAIVFAVCWGGEIGESGKNRLARAYGTPVVAALEAFHHDSGAYPPILRALVPRYLSPAVLSAPESSVLRYPFEYRVDSGGFELLVRYVGPGMNECRIHPGAVWHCGGYF